MRDYLAYVPCRQLCFNEKDPKASATAVADEIKLGMEYYVPHSDLVSKGRHNRWFNHECAVAVESNQGAYCA